MIRQYERTQGYWVYAHITPEKDVYIGMSKQQPIKRWMPSLYKYKSLAPYIEQYGWDNIEHRVLIDKLTKEQAEQIEDWFINKATTDGFCINKQRSGGIYRDNPKEYHKVRYETNRDKIKEYTKAYQEAHRDKIRERNKAYYEAHREEKKAHYEANREEKKAYNKQRRSTPEGKIYDRVHAYNQRHPDRKIITPAEAKEMYELTGYIPDFIKNDDLI